jgi:hypothetical protein
MLLDYTQPPVGASLLAMVVNDNARSMTKRSNPPYQTASATPGI